MTEMNMDFTINGFDGRDYNILKKINGGVNGTIILSRSFKIAPKNLLVRIKKYIANDLIEVSKTPQKPKGWKRHFKLSPRGIKLIEDFDKVNKAINLTDLSKLVIDMGIRMSHKDKKK